MEKKNQKMSLSVWELLCEQPVRKAATGLAQPSLKYRRYCSDEQLENAPGEGGGFGARKVGEGELA